MSDERPAQVGRYRLRRLLGTGGMAEIHLAERTDIADFRKELAVKLLHPHLRNNPAMLELFLHEARITASLQHPNIVQVFALEEADEQLFMVMEYVQGIDLRAVLTTLEGQGQTLSTDLSLAIAIEVAKALRFAHAALPERAAHHPPVIHRDLSPGNVMLAVSGAVKLLDFGVAKTLLGDEETDKVARGKWPYMSPEQVRGEPLDGRSDLFSLGAVLYELLTGRQAFGGATVVDSMRRVERADVQPAPGVEPVVEEILNTLLARERADRYADASEAVDAMAQVLMLRGRTTGERELAELVAQLLEKRPAPGITAPPHPAPTPRVAPAEPSDLFGVGDLTGQLTIPTHRPGELPASLSVASRAPKASPDETVTDPFGEGQTTLPPATTERPRPASRTDDLDEESEGETTAARPLSGEMPVLPSLVPDPEDTPAAPSPRHATTSPSPRAEAGPEPPLHASEPRVFFDHFMPADDLQDEPAAPRVWTAKNLVILALAVAAILIAGLAILLAIRQQMQRRQSTPVVATSRGAPRSVNAAPPWTRARRPGSETPPRTTPTPNHEPPHGTPPHHRLPRTPPPRAPPSRHADPPLGCLIAASSTSSPGPRAPR